MGTEAYIRPDPLARAAAEADVMMQQLQSDYQKSPTGRAEQAKLELMKVAGDPNKVAEARALQATIDRAEKHAAAEPIAMSDEARLEQAIAGVVERGAEFTWGNQIPQQDFAAQVADDLELGLREGLIRCFYSTGRGDDPGGREVEIEAAEHESKSS
jgi:hypothetical protein